MRVGEHLHLHVARMPRGALDQQVAVAKAGQCLRARAGQGGRQRGRLGHQTHAAAAATGDSLDHHGIADPVGLGDEARVRLVLSGVARQAGHALAPRQRLGRGLAAQGVDGRRRRADPAQAGGQHGTGKAGVLAQEAVAGVDGIGAGRLGRGQQLVHAQVAVGRGVATQRIGHGGLAHMQGARVGVGMHGDGVQPQAVGGGDHAAGDLAAVGNEDFLHDAEVSREAQRPSPQPSPKERGRRVAEQANPAAAVTGPAPGTGCVPPRAAEGGSGASRSGGCFIVSPSPWSWR